MPRQNQNFFGSPDFTEYLPEDSVENKVSGLSQKAEFPQDAVRKTDPRPQNADLHVTLRDKTEYKPSLQIVEGTFANRLIARVLDRLSAAYDREVDVWLKDDIKIAFLTVVYANEEGRVWGLDNQGDPFGPWEYAFCVYLGKHPKKLIPFFVERAEKHRYLDIPDYDPTTNKIPASPKKPLKPEARLYRDCRKETA